MSTYVELTCRCGKVFTIARDVLARVGDAIHYCSYTCYRKYHRA